MLIDKLLPEDKVFCSAYSNFLSGLIKHSGADGSKYDSDKFIYHLGESHCLSFARRYIIIKGEKYQIIPKLVFGAKAFHFSDNSNNKFNAITRAQFDSIPDGSTIFLSFGEIDCRHDEGFIAASTKLNLSIENLVSKTVKRYHNWFFEQNQSKNHKIFVFNVPAPIYRQNIGAQLNKKRAKTVSLFNDALVQYLPDYNFEIIDVFKFTVGDNGFSNGSFHIDDYHLSLNSISEIEKQLCW